MIRADVRAPTRGMVDTYRRYTIQTFERAGVRTVDRVARIGKTNMRQAMRGAGLGGLGNAIDSNADEKVVRYGRDGFSTSARFFTRTRSERTLGAIEAYTEGAEIRPTRSRWLWIPTDDIQRRAGNYKKGGGKRMTPALWRQTGLDRKIGRLFQIKSVNGYPLLVLQDVGVSAAGTSRSVKGLTKKGLPKKGQVKKELIVAFVGIPRTSRRARVNLTSILNGVRSQMPAIFASELAKERR